MLRIWFEDFWKDIDWDTYHNIFTDSLDMAGVRYCIDSKSPDLVIFNHCSKTHEKYKSCLKLLFVTDCAVTTFDSGKCHSDYKTETSLAGHVESKDSDFAIGYEFIDHPRYLRVPLYILNQWFMTRRFRLPKIVNPEKTRFCCFLFQNVRPERVQFLELLSNYKHVDMKKNSYNGSTKFPPNVVFASEEKWEQNWIIGKQDFLPPYKFNAAFENLSFPGYVTEKIFHAFCFGCIPIYFGHPDIVKDFKKEFFIFVPDFPSYDAVIERVREIDNNEELYRQMLPQNGEEQIKKLEFFQEDIAKFIGKI